MPTEWDAFFDWLMGAEGRVVHHDPDDTGGQTCWGIARKHHPDWEGWAVVDRHAPKQPPRAEIEPLVSAFYQKLLASWWLSTPTPLREVLCDIVVNMGAGRATCLLQEGANRASGQARLSVDGVIGPKTLAAVSRREPRALALDVCAVRLDAYTRIVARRPSQGKFLRGWRNRVASLKRFLSL
ncbi:glycoside hydrolase family 108 protein [Megalodesulfovibrio gigas]|uniref:glycoside hydrolase family 108 protein n=1 Tax=Megalodesulfovibrio gigas TaxID=879 RepID=UPI0004147AC9|nr:glycosyl hydrolase 108 family protein [Megalodesulfovibrio gigas]